MSLNEVASSERIHIGFFGKINSGKSSLVNALTGLNLSVVSSVKGTTTDPVKKAMELLPLGPVVIVDTPGFDDEGELGLKRVEKAKEILAKIHIGVLVVDSGIGLSTLDEELLNDFNKRNLPFIIALNKSDLLDTNRKNLEPNIKKGLYISAKTGEGINDLKEKLGEFAKNIKNTKPLIRDLVDKNAVVILVVPIDEAAPKGRLIMPQQMVIRDLLDSHSIVISCQVEELEKTLQLLREKPNLVVTDSQAFQEVAAIVPKDIFLTSFSILMARYKGDLQSLVEGAKALSVLKDGDKLLVAEGCVHHRQCNDIGTKKIPAWIEKYSNSKPDYTFVSGGDFPEDLSPFKLIVHCGGCMLNEVEMKNRIKRANEAGVPIVNYGMAIAEMNAILSRSLEPLKF